MEDTNIEKLKGQFWTDENEMITEIEALGYDVIYVDYDYIVVVDIDGRYDNKETKINIVRAGRTIAINI